MKRTEHFAFGATALALVIGFLYFQLVRSVEPLGLDQGLFACFGRWIPEGALPYRDLFDTKPPLQLYTWVLAWGLGGTARSAWVFEALWLAGTLGVIYLLAARLWGRWSGLLAAAFLFLGLWSPGFGGYWARLQAEELSALPILGAAWFALSARERPRLALAAGGLLGLAGLYKVPALAVGLAWPVFWLLRGPIRETWRGAGVRTSFMLAGIAAPWALAMAWFGAHGALGDLLEAVFVFQGHYAAHIAPPLSNVLEDLASTLVRAAPTLLVSAAVGLFALWRSDRESAVWVTSWLVLALAAVGAQRQLAGYHYLLPVPVLALTAARGVGFLVQGLRQGDALTRATPAVALVVVALCVAKDASTWHRAYQPAAAHQRGDLERTTYLQQVRLGPFSPAVEEEVARYLRARSDPRDRILIWGLAPGVYALADRRPVTRYPFHKLLLTDAPLSRRLPGLEKRRADFLRRLHADPPVYIVIGTRDPNGFEPQDSVTGMMQLPAFAELVRTQYRQDTQIGRFLVLRRNPPASESR